MKNPVRKAASLILCRDSHKLNSLYNYELLMLERNSGLQSWGSMMVFPGGKQDPKEDDYLVSEFGLKKTAIATALRECFQETGIFVSKNPLLQTERMKDLSELKLRFLGSQMTASNKNFSHYFQQISRVVSPCTDLLPFIRLITVPLIKQRFDTSFFIHKLEPFKFLNFLKYAEHEKYIHEQNQITMCEEYNRCQWLPPLEILRKYVKKQIKLAPPQFIMLNIMSTFHKYQELIHYLKECSQNPNNIGPNVVSMVPNKGYLKDKFAYAATLIGDHEFPFQNCIQNQSNEYLIEELKQQSQNQRQKGKNRFLFKKPLQFFEEEYSLECTVPGSVLNRFQDSNKLRETLQNYL